MPLFVISARDRADSLELRMATREAHFAYVNAHPGFVRLGGPYLDEEGRMAGSLMVVECEDLAAAERFHAGDPYKTAGLFESSTVDPWKVTLGALA